MLDDESQLVFRELKRGLAPKILPPVAESALSMDGNVKLSKLPIELLTQIVTAAPISRCESGNDSLK